MTFLAMTDLDLTDKRVLIRQDLNVPLQAGQITSDARIRAALPSLQQALAAGARVIVMSHLGRPTEGEFDDAYSLAPVAERLSQLLDKPVPLLQDWRQGVALAPGAIALLENVRFNPGEKGDDDTLAQAYAALCDIFVMDAFGTAHRAQASTHGVAKFAPTACAGPLLQAELKALAQALAKPARPMVAIVGGAKVSSKLQVLSSLADIADQIIVGGGIANTFLAASGKAVGRSLHEPSLIADAQALMAKTHIPLPSDVLVGSAFAADTEASLRAADALAETDMIFDVGPDTRAQLTQLLKEAKTILWNGPVGVFEFAQFAEGTRALAQAIADSDAFSIAGGGDTLAAIDQYGIADKLSYISTGGGAFLAYMEGKTLPAVAVLESSSSEPSPHS